jgi:hypothetical protein
MLALLFYLSTILHFQYYSNVTFSHNKSVKRHIRLEQQIYMQAGKTNVNNDNLLQKHVNMVFIIVLITNEKRENIYDMSFSHLNQRITHLHLILYDILSG